MDECSGDCDADGKVSIDELVLAVSVALHSMPVQSCLPVDRNGDARATIDELVGAVRAAIEGCPAVERSGPRPNQQAVAL